MSEARSYYLSATTRIMVIVPSMGALFLSFWFLSIKESFSKPVYLYGFCAFLAFIAIYFSANVFSSRLVISPNGLEIYRFFPFYRLIPWENIDKIVLDPLDEVDLICKSDDNQGRKQIISITAFNADWSDAGFLSAIRRSAPHVEIPQDLLGFRKPSFLYRSGTLLIYYSLIMPLGLFPYFLFRQAYLQYANFFNQASIGLLVSSLSGILGLLVYQPWAKNQSELDLVRRVTLIYYLVPFSGFMLVFLACFVYDAVSGYQRLPMWALLAISFIQLEILLRFVGTSLKTMFLSLDKK